MEALVSVIIPVYNVEKYLKKCVDSVLNQSYKNMEILLIDDGSTDCSPDICDYYCTIDNRIRCIHKANGGLGSARNVGIRSSRGDYIYFLDSDDFIDKDLFSSIIPYMLEKDLDVCFFAATVLFEDEEKGDINYYTKNQKYEPKDGKSLFLELRKNSEYIVSNCLFITKKKLIDEYSLLVPEGMYYEDNYFTFQLLMNAKIAGVVNKSYYYRRVHTGSIMTHKENYEKKVNSALKVIEQFNSYKTKNEEIKSSIKQISLDFCNNALYLANQSKDKVLINKVNIAIKKYRCFLNIELYLKKIIFCDLHVDYNQVKKIRNWLVGKLTKNS